MKLSIDHNRLARRMAQPGHDRLFLAEIARQAQQADGHIPVTGADNGHGVIGAAIINDQNFGMGGQLLGLLGDAAQGLGDGVGLVIGRDHEGQIGRGQAQHRLAQNRLARQHINCLQREITHIAHQFISLLLGPRNRTWRP